MLPYFLSDLMLSTFSEPPYTLPQMRSDFLFIEKINCVFFNGFLRRSQITPQLCYISMLFVNKK